MAVASMWNVTSINGRSNTSAKSKLQSGGSILSCSLGHGHPAFIEILAYAGFDAVTLDREHGAIGISEMEHLLMASRAVGITPFWRIGQFDTSELKRAMDVGYTHFVVPHIRNADDAERVIRATHYAPLGSRGVGPGRPIRFGLDSPADYFVHANDEMLVALMIEEPSAVDAIEDILSVDGVQLVQMGFWDLSVAYGVPFQERHPRLVEATERVLEAAKLRGVWVGVPPVSPEDMAHWEGKGARYFEVASAAGLLAHAAKECARNYGTHLPATS